MFKFLIQNVISIFFPSFIKVFLLNYIGHSINKTVKIGPVFLGKDVKLNLEKGASIGSFNIFMCHRVHLKERAFIRRLNTFKGFFDLMLNEGAVIGNFNRFVNGGEKLVTSSSIFSLGVCSNLTSKHYFDLTESIIIGNNTVIGGLSSQFWTHGFQHFDKGLIRNRVDGAIKIGEGVYVGSQVIFNPNVVVDDDISLGAGAVISRSISKQGTYVSQQLRFIETTKKSFYAKYKRVNSSNISVYKK